MPGLNEQLASLAARTRAWAEAQARQQPGARVRLRLPLDPGSALPKDEEALLGLETAPVGGPQPQPPWAPRLEAFQRQISECQRCPLGGRRRRLVFGEGPVGAPLAFVGGAPGPEDDAAGRPFQGPAGQLLDRMIAAMGFKRPQVYLLNALKCRSQADVEPAALEACRPYLQHQLDLVRPRVVVGLGALAVRVLGGGDQPLAGVRGRWGVFHARPFMPTYHPADLLADEGLKRLVWDDLRQVMKRLESRKEGP